MALGGRQSFLGYYTSFNKGSICGLDDLIGKLVFGQNLLNIYLNIRAWNWLAIFVPFCNDHHLINGA
jgi:hypothetical protein